MNDPIDALAIGENTFPFHALEDVEPMLVAAFDADIAVRPTIERDALTNLSEYDVVIDYLTDHTLSDAQLDGLLSFVKDGGGYVGVHCASVLTTVEPEDPNEVTARRDEPFPELRALLGGHFLTHPSPREFAVAIDDSDHPVTAGLSAFTVEDEPYQLDVDEDAIRVLARMDESGDLANMPVAWVREYGEGRVFYCSLGHTEAAFTHPTVRILFSRGARWAAGRDSVTTPER